MNRFLKTPHLPASAVRLCAVAKGQPYILAALQKLGIACIEVPEHPELAQPVRTHPDMLLHHLGGEDIYAASYSPPLILALQSAGFKTKVMQEPLGGAYPFDVRLNCFLLANYLFCNKKTVDTFLLNYYQSNGAEVVHSKQGYAKCSVCIVDENSIITEDAGIYRAAVTAKINALLILKGSVSLPGYDYGFIGGCSGKLDKHTLAFCGDIRLHPDYEKINLFCLKRGVNTYSLWNGPLTDMGGILPLMEAAE